MEKHKYMPRIDEYDDHDIIRPCVHFEEGKPNQLVVDWRGRRIRILDEYEGSLREDRYGEPDLCVFYKPSEKSFREIDLIGEDMYVSTIQDKDCGDGIKMSVETEIWKCTNLEENADGKIA